MSYADLWNAVKRIVEAQLASVAVPRRGIVTSVDPTKMRAKVQIQPDPTGQSVSNWYPIATPCMGPGWGIVAAPPIGAQVVLLPTDGDADAVVVHGAHWSNAQLPPPGYTVGELWFQHQKGHFVKLKNDGTVVVQDASGAFLTLNNNGSATLRGNLLIEGTVTTKSGDWGVGDLSVNGTIHATQDITASTAGQNISVTNHIHAQGDDSHGDGEQNTTSPLAGT